MDMLPLARKVISYGDGEVIHGRENGDKSGYAYFPAILYTLPNIIIEVTARNKKLALNFRILK